MCDEAISLYNSYLVENDIRPYPVYWTQPNCGGSFYPSFEPPSTRSGGSYSIESNVQVGSFYCPPFVDYKCSAAYDPAEKTKSSTKSDLFAGTPGAEDLEMLVEDANKICIVPVFAGPNVVAEPNLTMANNYSLNPLNGGGEVFIFYEYGYTQYDMCTGNTVSMGGDDEQQGPYYPQSAACDNYMNQFCAANPDKQICNCFRDRETLRKLMPDVVLPVRCLGPNCAITGYLTDTMLQQGCDIEMCQRVTQMYGANIVTGGQTSIYCGNRLYAVTPTPGPTATRPIQIEDDRISTATWILAAVGVVILAVVIGLFYRFRPGSKELKSP